MSGALPSDRAVAADAAEPEVSALRASIPSALLADCDGVLSGPNGRGGMRVVVSFAQPGSETSLFHLLSAAFAQAIEARRAETGTGSVHESAVPEWNAP